MDLRGGGVEIHELVNFVFEASALPSTKRHVANREEEAGPRGMREGLARSLLGFVESLGVDERQLQAENLTRLKEEL